MKLLVGTLFMTGAAMLAQAQPAIKAGGVVNSASYSAAGLPNAAIAQGSLFVVFGSGMGPAALQQITAYPLGATLGGTSLSVTVNGTTTKPLMVYTSAGQLGAILPSMTPVGTGTITVTYSGQTSAAAPIQVAASSFGIYSVNQAGSGSGIITNTNYQVASQTSASNPGEAFIIWGTGLGPVTGDEAAGGAAVKLGTIPVEVLIGGKSASLIAYARASCCAGLDQIAFTVPAGVTGCSVPVAIKIGNVVSNYVSLAIAGSGRTCTNPNGVNPVTGTQNGLISTGDIDLSRSNTSFAVQGASFSSVTDSGSGSFTKYQYADYSTYVSPLQISTIGACTVYTFTGQSGAVPTVPNPTVLDAGPSLTVNGPGGTKILTKMDGLYYAQLGGGVSFPGAPPSAPLYLTKGAYTVSGTGGADVGAFSAQLNIPDPLAWTNAASATTINRAAGQLITWTGGDTAGSTTIFGYSITGLTSDNAVGAGFVCVERTSAGQFTIPSAVLLSLPPSSSTITTGGGALSVGAGTTATFKANGLDQGTISSSSSTLQTVTYQ